MKNTAGPKVIWATTLPHPWSAGTLLRSAAWKRTTPTIATPRAPSASAKCGLPGGGASASGTGPAWDTPDRDVSRSAGVVRRLERRLDCLVDVLEPEGAQGVEHVIVKGVAADQMAPRGRGDRVRHVRVVLEEERLVPTQPAKRLGLERLELGDAPAAG